MGCAKNSIFFVATAATFRGEAALLTHASVGALAIVPGTWTKGNRRHIPQTLRNVGSSYPGDIFAGMTRLTESLDTCSAIIVTDARHLGACCATAVLGYLSAIETVQSRAKVSERVLRFHIPRFRIPRSQRCNFNTPQCLHVRLYRLFQAMCTVKMK